jgi:hypothetical protein
MNYIKKYEEVGFLKKLGSFFSDNKPNKEINPKEKPETKPEPPKKYDLLEDIKTIKDMSDRSDLIESIEKEQNNIVISFTNKVDSLIGEDNILKNKIGSLKLTLRIIGHTPWDDSLLYGFLVRLDSSSILQELGLEYEGVKYDLMKCIQSNSIYDYVRIENDEIWLGDTTDQFQNIKGFAVSQTHPNMLKSRLNSISGSFKNCAKIVLKEYEDLKEKKRKIEEFKEYAGEISDCLIELEDMSKEHKIYPNMDQNQITFSYSIDGISKISRGNGRIMVTDELLGIFKILNTAKKNIQALNPNCEIFASLGEGVVDITIDKALANIVVRITSRDDEGNEYFVDEEGEWDEEGYEEEEEEEEEEEWDDE